MGPSERAAFALAAAERALGAVLSVGDDEEARQLVDRLRTTLGAAGECLSADDTNCRAQLEDAAAGWEAAVPDEDAPGFTELLGYAANAIAAVVYALRCTIGGDVQSAVWAARQPSVALDWYLTNRLDFDPSRPGDEEMVARHPLLQAELKRQLRDIQELEASDCLTAATFARVRSRAREDAASLFAPEKPLQ